MHPCDIAQGICGVSASGSPGAEFGGAKSKQFDDVWSSELGVKTAHDRK